MRKLKIFSIIGIKNDMYTKYTYPKFMYTFWTFLSIFSFVACGFTQVYLDNNTAKKVISELIEFDGLKKTYSLLDQRFEVLEKEYSNLGKDLIESQTAHQKVLANFDSYKNKRKKRRKNGRYMVAGFGGILTAIAISNLKEYDFGDGISRGLIVAGGIYFTIGIVL